MNEDFSGILETNLEVASFFLRSGSKQTAQLKKVPLQISLRWLLPPALASWSSGTDGFLLASSSHWIFLQTLTGPYIQTLHRLIRGQTGWEDEQDRQNHDTRQVNNGEDNEGCMEMSNQRARGWVGVQSQTESGDECHEWVTVWTQPALKRDTGPIHVKNRFLYCWEKALGVLKVLPQHRDPSNDKQHQDWTHTHT